MLKAQMEKQFPELTVHNYSLSNPIKAISKGFFGWDDKKDDAGRKLLQDLGKVGREYNQNLWVKHLLTQMDRNFGVATQIFPTNFILIDDWRFPNEYEYLKSNPVLDIITIRVAGRGGLQGETANDVSENSLPEPISYTNWENETLYNFGISNDKELENLENCVGLILHQISKQYIVE